MLSATARMLVDEHRLTNRAHAVQTAESQRHSTVSSGTAAVC